MPRIGYARVSSTGQSLEFQLEKLNQAKCDWIYQEKRNGRTADRPEFQSCMNDLREGDTLIITRLDRLARSVVYTWHNWPNASKAKILICWYRYEYAQQRDKETGTPQAMRIDS